MADIKGYIWVFPIVAGILGIITLITPVVSMNFLGYWTANLWLWGLYVFNYAATGGPAGTTFPPEILISSLIISSLIGLCVILLIITGLIAKRKNDLRKVKIPSIATGVILIIAEILWLILVPGVFPIQDYLAHLGPPPPEITYDFWNMTSLGISISMHTVSFGLIGGFLTAGLSFAGAGAAHYYSKEREVKITEKKEITPPIEKTTTSVTSELKFCPECGAGIEEPDIKFCGNCGYEFKTPELAPL
ncbi:MAG: zinc ribbon domain-containing protein [Promethearchaeota archaeon]